MKTIGFNFPINGDCLNSYDGEIINGVLYVNTIVCAPSDSSVYVNGVKAVCDGESFKVSLPLTEGKNLLCLSVDGETKEKITVYDFRCFEKKYRISSDDNILFLRDINDNKDIYKSIFDNPYLAMYKKAHYLYGACVNINLFYETDAMKGFNEKGKYFNLSMMTDKFKSEWEENSDWLRLTFHARSEFPDKPYQFTSAERIREDALRIHEEIIRFAGEKSVSSTTTVHWGEATEEGVRALREIGYTALAGYFTLRSDGTPSVSYFYPKDIIEHVGSRDFWMNEDLGVLHARIDLVLNSVKYEQLADRLEEIKVCPHRAGFLDLMIHEQYFYPEYKYHIPRFADIVIDAAKWAAENGYEGTFFESLYS